MMIIELVLLFSVCTPSIAGQRVDRMVRVPRRAKDMPHECSAVAMNDRVECPNPGMPMDESSCASAHCCMNPSFKSRPSMCFFPQGYRRYYVHDSHISGNDDLGVRNESATLFRQDDLVDTEPSLWLNAQYPSRDVAHIELDVIPDVKDPYVAWVPPVPVLHPNQSYLLRLYHVELLEDGTFTIYRRNDLGPLGVPIFRTNFSYLTYNVQHMEITLFLPSSNVYGLGDRLAPLKLPIDGFYLYNRDFTLTHDGRGIGTHPMYICMEDGGSAHGVYLHNSNPLEVILYPNPAVTFRVYGGKLDFYVFSGPTVRDVIRQYLDLVGRPAMPPYWALGYHLSRSDYKTVTNMENTLKRNIDKDILVEAIWNDIEYTQDRFAFTLADSFEGLGAFVEKLHVDYLHYVPTFTPVIRTPTDAHPDYHPYDLGVEMDIFVKNSSMDLGTCYVSDYAQVTYIDFTSDQALQYWAELLDNFHSRVEFDGIWIRHTGIWCVRPENDTQCSQTSTLERPPNYPQERLDRYTLCMEDVFKLSKHYNVHNLFAYYAAMVTHKAMVQKFQKRPLVMASCTFAGQGKWSGHWTDWPRSTWESMRESIPMLLTLNLLGMPFVGTDIGGSDGNTSDELYIRWHALAAFYPFARNHKGPYSVDQDPAAMAEAVTESVKWNIYTRYLFLPYMYTLFYRHHVYSEPVMRPLFYEFPEDPDTYDIDYQFMLGPAILVCPVLHPGIEILDSYFPRGLWYDLKHDVSKPVDKGKTMESYDQHYDIFVYIRGGHVVARQGFGKSIHESRTRPFELYIALDHLGEAVGELYWDDGISENSYEEGAYTLYGFQVSDSTLIVNLIKSGYDTELTLAKIKVYGVPKDPAGVLVNDLPVRYDYVPETQDLVIDTENYVMEKCFTVSWKTAY
ncbi:lysosomal alpha-glucosidase-like [Ornithodoros turicata]|uniref:lysosomal alpha-glucosidase-like n=1 Tax=Ornithodoros turicata TaxID=34597 RepID=UPI003138C9E7